MPQFHTPDTLRADREFAEQILRRADGLIAVSHKSKQDAVEILRVPPERIQVIYHGVEESYFQVSPARIGEARKAYSLQRPYILFVSMIEPRKNLDRLITAYQEIPPTLGEEFDLVVAGPVGWNSEQTLKRLGSGLKGVRYLGYVPERLLPGLLAGATVFAYPSMYEGFGLPVLQAMAAGIPAIISNAGSLPEVAGEYAFYVDPESVSEIRDALSSLLSSPAERVRRSEGGSAHAATYQWSKCAEQSWEFFKRVVES
jgi:alpha-1,3-rhamnosyl/mannosyltransferase